VFKPCVGLGRPFIHCQYDVLAECGESVYSLHTESVDDSLLPLVSANTMDTHSTLGTGIFTVPEAARLLQVSDTKIRGWIEGYRSAGVGPLIEAQLGKHGRTAALTFTNLMEARFIDAFVQLGVHVRTIRAILEEARNFVRHPHPFATDTVFKTDGQKIFAEVETKTGDKHLYDLKRRNWAIREVLGPLLKGEVSYNESGMAQTWQPRPNRAPNVILDPRFAFGRPIVRGAVVPTSTILDAFVAEGDIPIDRAYENVASWYQVPIESVREAIDFEFSLRPKKAA
jgi:uncharacterized protein (DUF433 family)